MPTPYVWAWIIVTIASLGLLFALQRTLRGWDAPASKVLAGCWVFVILLVPAQIPGHGDSFAPALIVFLFESLLQREGNPGPAERILAAASVLALVVGLVWLVISRRRRGRRTPAT